MKVTIEELDLKSLKPTNNNPRQIKKDDFEILKRSLKEFPEMQDLREIVVDENYTILGGHQRVKAMLANGQTIAKVKVATGLTEAQKREFIIKDNIANGEWDFDVLANEWDEEPLSDWGLEVSGFEDEEEAEIEEDEVPEPPEEPRAKLGDIYQLGNHRLMCGDSTKLEDVEKLLDGQKADLVFTDPPYGYKYQSNGRKKTKKFDVLKNDDKILDFFEPLKIVNNGFVFVCTTWKVLDKWIPLFKSYYELTNMVIWNKGGGGIGDLKHTFSTDYEIILCSNNGMEITGKRIGSIWNIKKDNADSYIHATQKPVELPALAIKNTTKQNNIVLDVFAGSGSTIIACEQLDRKCYSMELDPKYVDVIIERWEKFTGKKAKLINNGN